MSAGGSAKAIAVGTTWRVTGAASAGRRLVAAAAGGDEDERTIAGMLLVRGGDRAVPLVAEALAAGAGSPVLVDVLASIGSPLARAELHSVTSASSPEVAAAAREALRTLDEIPGED